MKWEKQKTILKSEGVTGKFSATQAIFTRKVLCKELHTILFGEQQVLALGLAPALY